MKLKKLLAILTVTAMLISPMTVFADQTTTSGISIESDATVDYVDPASVIKITVPTNVMMNFTLDPQNLAATQGVGVWNPTSGGAIIAQSVVTVVNKSAVPIKTTVDFTVTDEATSTTTLVDSDTDINDGTDKKMHLTVTPANAKTSITTSEVAITTVPTFFQSGGSDKVFTAAELETAGIASGNIISNATSGSAVFADYICTSDSAIDLTYNQVEVPVIGTTISAITATTVGAFNLSMASTANAASVTTDGAILAYVMNNAEYYVANNAGTYSLVYRDKDTNTNFDTASFIIGGTINKNADWSEYDADTKINLEAAYTFETMKDADGDAALADKLAGSYNSVATTPPAPPSADPTYLGSTTKTVALNSTTFEVDFDLGTGDKAVTVTTIEITALGEDHPVDNTGFTVANGKITFSNAEGHVDYILTTPGTYPIKITTSDSNIDTIDVTVE